MNVLSFISATIVNICAMRIKVLSYMVQPEFVPA